MQSKIAVILKP